VVLDIIELKNAQSAEQKAIFGTQLGFDATGLALSVGSIGLEMAGATTAAAFGGALAVPLGGLTIGFTALAEQ